MMQFLIDIPEQYQLEQSVDRTKQLKSRIFSNDNSAISDMVEKITWMASIKSEIGDVEPARSENIRYDELEIFLVSVNDYQNLYNICKPIYRSVAYPCLLLIQYETRLTISTCQFSPGKRDYNRNIIHAIQFSHWIFPDMISSRANDFIQNINQILSSGGNLSKLYTKLDHEVSYFRIGGISKNHTKRLLSYMIGEKNISSTFWDECTPYKKYTFSQNNLRERYKKHNGSYVYSFDIEDLWHTFLKDEMICKSIKGHRYRDIEDLIYQIDSKCFDEDVAADDDTDDDVLKYFYSEESW